MFFAEDLEQNHHPTVMDIYVWTECYFWSIYWALLLFPMTFWVHSSMQDPGTEDILKYN